MSREQRAAERWRDMKDNRQAMKDMLELAAVDAVDAGVRLDVFLEFARKAHSRAVQESTKA